MSDKFTNEDGEARAQEIAAAFLEAHRGWIVQALSERLRQTGSEDLMPVCCDLLEGVRTYVRTPFPRRLISGVHRTLAGAGCDRRGSEALISGLFDLWGIIHQGMREVDGPHKPAQLILETLVLVGDALDGIVGLLADISRAGTPSKTSPHWETMIETGKTRRQFHTLNRIIRELLGTRDPDRMFQALERGILDTFNVRSLLIATVNEQERYVEVVRAYPAGSPENGPIGWRYDLDYSEILCEVARSGRLEVIDGWDPRYHQRVVLPGGEAVFRQRPRDYNEGHTAFFVPILAGDRVIGVVCTASTQESREIVLREIETMRPFLDQVGATLSTVSEIIERKRAGERLERSQEQLRDLSARLVAVREEERARISREVHDELGQALTVLKMDLAWLSKRFPRDQRPSRERARQMSQLIGKTLQAVRRISTELRPGILDDLGLIAAIEWQAEEFQTRTGIRCLVQASPEDITLDQAHSTTVFRIFQETLTNVARHANASRVRIVVTQADGGVEMEVRDNGRGITPDQVTSSRSLGLVGMRERAAVWGGEVDIFGAPGGGTTIRLRISKGGEQP